ATAYKVWAFVVGAVLAGIAGGLAAHFTFFIGPNEYGFERAVSILLYAIVGGVTTFWGPLAGSALLTVLPEVLRALGVQAGAVRLFVNGAILVAVVLFAPNGLAGLVRRTLPPGPLSDTERGNGKAAGWWSRPLSTLWRGVAGGRGEVGAAPGSGRAQPLVRRCAGGGWRVAGRWPGGGVRPDRPERRRQDDVHQPAHRPAAAGLRPRHVRRA
ncbi:MAG: branched-chain amino acid ABC transporter permease, partial [Chloroflexota bacterium]